VVPRSALVDPFGAVWTATIFIATIVLLVGLSAGGKLEHRQGVWTVTAPAAVLVLLRDLVYDLLRPPKALSAAPQDRSEVEQANKAAVGQVNTQGTVHHPVTCLRHRLPTVSAVVAHLPLTLLPFAFSMFILVNALEYTGWVNLWAGWWAAWARVGGVAGCVWLMGMLSVIGCNVSPRAGHGTN
jgi:hypothetical protein